MINRLRNRRLSGVMSAAAITVAIASTFGWASANAQAARDYISIVGSSTVYPFATVVAERFGRATHFRTPTIESTGTGGGFKLFCGGIGVQYPDISDASRQVKPSEVATCAANGVKDIVEVKIGYDGIVIANSRSAPQADFSLEQLYLALAKNVPAKNDPSKLVPNPYVRWSDIDPSLPSQKILVLGPPPTSGTRDAFVELVMDAGCEHFPAIEALDGSAKQAACQTIREDGSYVEAGENDNLIVQKLETDPTAFGIFGYSFLDQNSDKIQGSMVAGVEPDFDAISGGVYPISRPLFFYVKTAHVGVIPGLKEYLDEFTSDAAWGEYGYLADIGLIPMSDEDRAMVRKRVVELESLASH